MGMEGESKSLLRIRCSTKRGDGIVNGEEGTTTSCNPSDEWHSFTMWAQV